MRNTQGLKRGGPGRRRGGRNKATMARVALGMTKEQAREALCQKVYAEFDALIEAQLANAKGLKYLVTREKNSGKFIRVTEAMAKAKQGDTEEIIEVWEKDPSVQAFTDLLNRALDKPKEQEQTLNLKGDADLIASLMAGRKRAAEARKGQ